MSAPDWPHWLHEMDELLAQSLKDCQRREKLLAATQPPEPADAGQTWRVALDRFGDWLGRWQEQIDRVAKQTREVEAAQTDVDADLLRWRAKVTEAGRQLVAGPTLRV